MDVAVAGGHGQVGLRLLGLLADRGDRARGLIRNPDHAADLEAAGAEPVVCDLEGDDDVAAVIASSMGADDPPPGDEVFAVYLQAKAAADQALRESGLEFTIVRPGRLTNDRGTGRIEAAESLGRRGEIPRDDVAATLVAVLDEPATVGRTFEVLGGEEEIAAALRTL